MVIYLEEFINKELKPKYYFKDFLLLIDDTQNKPEKFLQNYDQIIKIQKELLKNFNKKLFIKYKNLLKTYYFDLLAPEEWIIDFYAFHRRKIKGIDLSQKWMDLCKKSKTIEPYLPFKKKNTKISYQRNIL